MPKIASCIDYLIDHCHDSDHCPTCGRDWGEPSPDQLREAARRILCFFRDLRPEEIPIVIADNISERKLAKRLNVTLYRVHSVRKRYGLLNQSKWSRVGRRDAAPNPRRNRRDGSQVRSNS